MSGSQYAPGTHVKATVSGEASEVRGFLTVDGGIINLSEHWLSAEVTDVRPLVVLDPDDTAQVDALAFRFACRSKTVREALRDLAPKPIPVKPDEPTGLGAMVEDTRHRVWIRHLQGPAHHCWTIAGQTGPFTSWAEIDAVGEPLAQGVTR